MTTPSDGDDAEFFDLGPRVTVVISLFPCTVCMMLLGYLQILFSCIHIIFNIKV